MLLAGQARGYAWWRVCAKRFRFGAADGAGRIVNQGREEHIDDARYQAELALPEPVSDPDLRRLIATNRDLWRQSSSGDSLVMITNGYACCVGEDWYQVRELSWVFGHAMPGEHVLARGRPSSLQEAMVAAWSCANPAPRAQRTPTMEAEAAPPIATPRGDRAQHLQAKRVARQGSAESYLEHLHRRLCYARRCPPIAPTSAALRAELEANLAAARARITAEHAAVAAAEARPDSWPTKPQRVAKARTQLAIAECQRELAELALGNTPARAA